VNEKVLDEILFAQSLARPSKIKSAVAASLCRRTP
jgi:hypothetical protein